MYTVLLLKPARKVLDSLDPAVFRRVTNAIKGLANEARPKGMRKLSGSDDLYRIRVGDWRIVYAIQDRKLVILVILIGHRREIYRGMRR